MIHNHMMNNKQQTTLTNPGAATSVGGQSMILNKSPYQMESSSIAQLSHLQQQQEQIGNSYQSHRQTYPGISLPSTIGTMSGFDLENGHFGMQRPSSQYFQHQEQPQIQTSAQQHRYEPLLTSSQRKQKIEIPIHQQSTFHSVQQQRNHLPHQPFQLQQSNYQQKSFKIQQQLQQQNMHQQHNPQQQTRILKNPSNVSTAVSGHLQQPAQLPSSLQTQQHVTSASVNNDQKTPDEGEKEDDDKVEEKSASDEASQESKNNAAEKLCLANTKEKTPLCLFNELAHFNKLSHQCVLVDEQGPAHKKMFYVKLKLADEEYSASGESIKKAQHAAAAIALKETKYVHPPPKSARFCAQDAGKERPTLELHALAVRRGETVTYKTIESPRSSYYRCPGMDYRGFYNMRYPQYMRASRDPYFCGSGGPWPVRPPFLHRNFTFFVCVRVGHREFMADGQTRQEACHNAAQKALHILKNLPIQNDTQKKQDQTEDINEDDDLKSEISLVHELAFRLNLPVSFRVIQEGGLAHMKNFITRCTVGDMVTEGEGNSKKMAKKKAAEQMLEKLKKLPGASSEVVIRSNFKSGKKKNRILVKTELQQQKTDPCYGVDVNPISRLVQIMQAKKKKGPVYTVISERGLPRREFVIQVEVEGKTCTGTGPNKKFAKRSAAEAMLEILGCIKPSPQPARSSLKHSISLEGNQTGDKRVTFVESHNNIAGKTPSSTTPQVLQQKVPGLLHLPTNTIKFHATSGAPFISSPPQSNDSPAKLASIFKPNLQPEVQLEELCKAFNYELDISDFTKQHVEGIEHFTRITIEGEPQNFFGSSNTVESSRNMAAQDALKVLLAKIGAHPYGDGPQVKEPLSRSSVSLKEDISK